MEYRAVVKRVQGNEVTLVVDGDFKIPNYFKNEKGLYECTLIPQDSRCITPEQRAYIYGLFADVSEYTGYTAEEAKVILKMMYAYSRNWEDFSLAHNQMSMDDARLFIEWLIDFCFQEKIPFRHQKWHIDSKHTRILFLYLKYRRCFISGERGEVAHYDAVGMGRNRKKIDHSKHRFMCLSHKYHMLQHSMGLEPFCDEYNVKPITLTPQQVKEFGIGKCFEEEEVKEDG